MQLRTERDAGAARRDAPGRVPLWWSPWHGLVAVLVAVGFAVHLMSPDDTGSELAYFVVVAGAAVTAWVGARRAPPRHALVPLLIAIGLSLSVLGDVIWFILQLPSGSVPVLSLADVPHFASYLVLGAALVIALLRSDRQRQLNVDAVIDALTVLVISLLVTWNFAIRSLVNDDSLSVLVRTVSAAYPVLDAVILAFVLRGLSDRRSRAAVGVTFAVGVGCWLAADIATLMLQVAGTTSRYPQAGWMLGALLMATTTWARETPSQRPTPEESNGKGKLAVAAFPLLVPVALELYSHERGLGGSPYETLAATVVLVALAYARTARLLRTVDDARASAAASHRHYSHLAANSSDAVIVVDADGRVTRDSPQLVSLVGYPGPSAGTDWVAILSPLEAWPLEQEFARVQQTPGAVVTTEVVIDRGTEAPIWLSARMVNMLDDPDVLGVVIALGDITERKETEFELAVARDAALEASRAKSAFLATMSHEIRTPMNGVTGLAGLLLTTPLAEDQRQYADGIRKAGDALLAIINDILDFSKVEAGKLVLERLDLDLEEVVTGVGELVAASARAKGLKLHTSCSPAVPPVVIGDPVRLRQVLLNLASNAVKFTASGEVRISAHPERESAEETFIRFEVSDTGIGIDEANREALFAPFTQADSSTTRQYGGTGLGLAISRQLVSAMKGELGVDSTRGVGSRFWFTVPFEHPAQPEPPERPDRHARQVVAAPASESGCQPARGHVLVVEDNDINQLVAVGILDHLGFTSELASNGHEALALLISSSFDAVLMDCQMPQLDGFEATVELRRIEDRLGLTTDGRGRTPVIAMTAGVVAGDRERCLAAGMDDYVAKPVSPVQLQTALARWVPASTA